MRKAVRASEMREIGLHPRHSLHARPSHRLYAPPALAVRLSLASSGSAFGGSARTLVCHARSRLCAQEPDRVQRASSVPRRSVAWPTLQPAPAHSP